MELYLIDNIYCLKYNILYFVIFKFLHILQEFPSALFKWRGVLTYLYLFDRDLQVQHMASQ